MSAEPQPIAGCPCPPTFLFLPGEENQHLQRPKAREDRFPTFPTCTTPDKPPRHEQHRLVHHPARLPFIPLRPKAPPSRQHISLRLTPDPEIKFLPGTSHPRQQAVSSIGRQAGKHPSPPAVAGSQKKTQTGHMTRASQQPVSFGFGLFWDGCVLVAKGNSGTGGGEEGRYGLREGERERGREGRQQEHFFLLDHD